jgi:hypothetical protein
MTIHQQMNKVSFSRSKYAHYVYRSRCVLCCAKHELQMSTAGSDFLRCLALHICENTEKTYISEVTKL